jgi:hypothetical protein
LLFLRLVQFAGEPRNLGFLASTGGTATAHSLEGFRLAASRFGQFAACSGAPSHRPSQRLGTTPVFKVGLHQGFAAGEMGCRGHLAQQQFLETDVRYGSKADMTL